MKPLSIVKIALSILFLVCLADMPYSYFQLVRFLGMAGFVILAYDAYARKSMGWLAFYGFSALLINPFMKVALGRGLWNMIDVVWAVILIGSLFQNPQSFEDEKS